MRIFFILNIFFILLVVSSFAQTPVLSGSVRDTSTKEPLVAANIRIDGTTRGTITNADGFYRLPVPRGRCRIIFSFIGYKPDTLDVELTGDAERNVLLKETPIQLSGIVVTDEDPAYAIMRKVIENKKLWTVTLKSYQLEAFTRQIIRRDTAIASITESYTTGYWQQGDTLREIIRQQRQTQNIPMAQNLAAIGGIANFYQDEIRFSGFRFVGPTSPDAFDYYDFKLEQTRERNGIEFYAIRLIPKSRITPLFRGLMTIISHGYAVVGVEVSPNEAYAFPFVSEINLQYAQQFSLYENIFWMPVDIRVKGYGKIGVMGLSFPLIGFEQISTIYDYRINGEIPDSILQKPRRSKAPEAERFDSTFWAQREVLPLSREEQTAYRTLDSSQSLQKQFQPSGPLTFLGSGEGSLFLGYSAIRFNRVEGLFLGVKATFDSTTRWLKTSVDAGYGLSDERSKFGAGIELFLDSARQWSLGARGYNDIASFSDVGSIGTLGVSLSSLLFKNDTRDYYYTQGFEVSSTMRPLRNFSLRLGYRNEDQTPALQRTNYSLFYRRRAYRPNPRVEDGTTRSIILFGRYGDDPAPFGLVSRNFLEVEVERSESGLLKSSFSFTRGHLLGELNLPTFLQRNLFPPSLSLRLAVGASSGKLPVQRMFSIESHLPGYGPFGVLRGVNVKEFAGEQFVMLNAEHNFRSVPFLLLNIPFLYRNSIELIVHASAARSWTSPTRLVPYLKPTNGWYSEAGMGISKVFGLLRFDVTYRFFRPAGTFFTIALARIF